jgi:FAD/FMN-containing dehydrogenase
VSAYEAKLARLREQLAECGAAGLGLSKSTSNLFRDSANRPRPRVDLSGFNQVIAVDPGAGTVESEGMVTYADLADATLAHGTMPCVVPQLRSITFGGAVAGVGIESSSFKYGLVHETLQSIDVLLAGGRVVTCTPQNEHRDLFYGFPNSYGTLGYLLKATAKTAPVKRYVRIDHLRHDNPQVYFQDLERQCDSGADFVDGTVFSGHEMYITVGRFVDEAPWTSDYSFEHIYYRSIREKQTDYLTARDYLWRWDTDWFWCSKNVYAQNPLVRRLYGRGRLNSVVYSRIMRWNSRLGLTRALDRMLGLHSESIIQDVDVPVEHCAEFLAFLLRETGILPIWICPIRAYDAAARFPLYPVAPGRTYVNFGFWDVVKEREQRPPGHRNRAIERKVTQFGGIKSLYSDSYFSEEEFWKIYNGPAFRALKERYDPAHAFRDLYRKCVLKERGAS